MTPTTRHKLIQVIKIAAIVIGWSIAALLVVLSAEKDEKKWRSLGLASVLAFGGLSQAIVSYRRGPKAPERSPTASFTSAARKSQPVSPSPPPTVLPRTSPQTSRSNTLPTPQSDVAPPPLLPLVSSQQRRTPGLPTELASSPPRTVVQPNPEGVPRLTTASADQKPRTVPGARGSSAPVDSAVWWLLGKAALALVALVVALLTVLMSLEAKNALKRVGELANLESTSWRTVKDWGEKVTLGLYSGGSADHAALVRAIDTYQSFDSLQWTLLWLLAFICGGFAILGVCSAKPAHRREALALHLLVPAALALFVGVFAPCLSFINTREIALIGKIVAESETKSVWSAITALFASGSWAIGMIILAFSVVMPACKLSMLTSVMLLKHQLSEETRDRMMHWVERIGKYSFVDLFVAAILLSMFALKSKEGSQTQLEPGLYSFAAYCLIVLSIGYLFPHSHRSPSASTTSTA